MYTPTKTTPTLFLVLVLIAAAVAIPIAFAAPTVQTGKAYYDAGESLTVTGTADVGSIVSIQILDPTGARKAIAQAMAGSDGSYTAATIYTVAATDLQGTWTVKAYQGGVTAETVFTVGVAPPTGEMTLTISITPNRYSITCSTDEDGFDIILDETGANTGLFKGSFYFNFDTVPSTAPNLNIDTFDIITITYDDPETATGATDVKTTTAIFATHTGVLELDRSSYTAYWQVGTVTLTDPDLNNDPSTQQITPRTNLGTLDEDEVAVHTTSNSTSMEILMTETAVNSGVFEGQFTFDDTDSASDIQPTVEVESGDLITVSYKEARDVNQNKPTLQVTATFTTTTTSGSVRTSDAVYSPSETIEVWITDPDLDTNSAVTGNYGPDTEGMRTDPTDGKSRVFVVVTSSTGAALTAYPSNGTGNSFAITETGPNTGVFYGTHPLDGEAGATDIINVYYEDASSSAGAKTEFFAVATVTVNTGTVSLDKSVYRLGETITITVTDPDGNIAPGATNTISQVGTETGGTGSGIVDVQTTTSGAGSEAIRVELAETGVNTGIFTAEITTTTGDSTAGARVKANRGDTLTVTYHDALNSGEVPQDIPVIATLLATTGTVSLDKSVYSRVGQVVVTVTDDDMNVNTGAADSLTDPITDGNLVRVRTSTNPAGTLVSLIETGPNTGIFEAIFQLGGAGYTVTVGDGIRVEYTDLANILGQDNVLIVATATVETTDGTVSFDNAQYEMSDTATITVTDVDLNTIPSAPETLAGMAAAPGGAVLVQSTSDPIGIVIATSETGSDTGIFTTTITFTSANSAGTALRAQSGDTVTVLYRDWAPAGIKPGELGVVTEDVSATATIGTPRPEIPITSTAPALQDVNGNPIDQGAAGTQILLSTDMTNTATIAQPMLYIVQVKDAAGTVVYISFVSGTIPADTSYSFGIAWTPNVAGSYTVEVFAWESWTEPVALSVMQSSAVSVV